MGPSHLGFTEEETEDRGRAGPAERCSSLRLLPGPCWAGGAGPMVGRERGPLLPPCPCQIWEGPSSLGAPLAQMAAGWGSRYSSARRADEGVPGSATAISSLRPPCPARRYGFRTSLGLLPISPRPQGLSLPPRCPIAMSLPPSNYPPAWLQPCPLISPPQCIWGDLRRPRRSPG